MLQPYYDYLGQRIAAYPDLTGALLSKDDLVELLFIESSSGLFRLLSIKIYAINSVN